MVVVTEFTWLTGRIEIGDDGEKRFREARSDGELYEIAPGVAIPDDQWLHMAKLRDEDFDPVGPVLDIEEPLDSDPEGTLAEFDRIIAENEAKRQLEKLL